MGNHKFRVVLRAGTPFAGSLLTNFFVTWSKLPTLGTAPAGSPGVVKAPAVTFTAGTPAAGALPGGASGTAYATQTFGAQGGSGSPTTWFFIISAGTLPPGLTPPARHGRRHCNFGWDSDFGRNLQFHGSYVQLSNRVQR